MKKTLGIIGSGDLGQQIAHYAVSDGHYRDVVFFDDFALSNESIGFKLIGGIDKLLQAYQNKIIDEIIIAIGYKHLKVKKELYLKFKDIIPFGRIIHSTSWIDKTAIVEEGCVVYPGCFIDANSKIKANTVLNINCSIAHDTCIGSHTFLSPRVAIAGFVKIGEECVLGINSTIIDNITICNYTQIGGGTVVIKNIESKGLYVGNPAKFIR